MEFKNGQYVYLKTGYGKERGTCKELDDVAGTKIPIKIARIETSNDYKQLGDIGLRRPLSLDTWYVKPYDVIPIRSKVVVIIGGPSVRKIL